MEGAIEENDEKQLYEVNEEYEENAVGFKGTIVERPGFGVTTARQHAWRLLSPVLNLLLLIILVLVVILQSATLYQVRNTNQEISTTSGSSGALTGDGGAGSSCNCSTTELLDRLNVLLKTAQDIVEFNEMQSVFIENTTETLGDNYATTQQSAQRLSEIVGSLSNIRDNSIATESTVNDMLLKVEAILSLQNSSQGQQPSSCQDIRDQQPNSPSGYYHINSQIVYCEMGELCGTDGGWTRLAYLDMTDSTQDCPEDFLLYQSGGVRACGRPGNTASCVSLKFPSNGISYSEVCGRVTGYQYASTDAVDTRFIPLSVHNDINSHYVDGVSITYGYPRKHIWTMMSGVSGGIYDDGNCPCNSPPGGTQDVQSFIGNDYFCESGNSGGWSFVLYANDPVWDGEGCGLQEGNCCAAPGLPWFYRTLDATTDYLEIRVCGDQNPYDEDTPVSYYEVYIK